MAALAVVRTGPETLAGRLAAAERAQVAPRKKAAELSAALTAAVGAHDYAAADQLQPQLQQAREELALAEVEARIVAEVAAAAEAERQAEREAIARARDVDVARGDRDRAMAERQAAQEASAALRAQIPAAIAAVQKLLADALAADQRAAIAEASAVAAKVRTGECPPGTGSHLFEPTKALLDRDETIRRVREWTRARAGLPDWAVGPQ
jgi:hypothetical protein